MPTPEAIAPETIAAEIAAQCLVMRVRRLNREVTRIYDAEARRHDLTAGRATVLIAVATNPGASASDFLEPLSMDKSTLSRNLDRLEADGLVRTETDGRTRRLFPTDAGRDRIAAIHDDWKLVQERARALLGELVDPLMSH
ncbi:MAG: MarR family transcriptional regulator [Alphaproteobacteria bacterium]|nr:MarR family transcriptional regulator [Alphaproteobacteria bacterium]